MNQKLRQIFQNIPQIEPTAGLQTVIFARIEAEEAKKLRWKLAVSRIVSLGSAVATLMAIVTLGQEFVHSEFMNMASLFFSDMNIVIANGSDFVLSLLETFPTVTVSLILLPLFAFFLSLSSYLDLNNSQRHKYI